MKQRSSHSRLCEPDVHPLLDVVKCQSGGISVGIQLVLVYLALKIR
jgi:hypothetical protein